MKIEEAKKIITGVIINLTNKDFNVTEEMNLIGENTFIDSMKLVEICISLEDIADDHGFVFDWTSDSTLSKSRSMFRNIKSLAEEFVNQSKK
ncbi:hypothetical protein N9324_00130 [Candidatus Pelagibacter sp.]|nr:hypothetical protein [Candidatus Pelagibacter sp.]